MKFEHGMIITVGFLVIGYLVFIFSLMNPSLALSVWDETTRIWRCLWHRFQEKTRKWTRIHVSNLILSNISAGHQEIFYPDECIQVRTVFPPRSNWWRGKRTKWEALRILEKKYTQEQNFKRMPEKKKGFEDLEHTPRKYKVCCSKNWMFIS